MLTLRARLNSSRSTSLRVASNGGILAALVLEALASDGCVLVFCATKLEVMMAARRICEAIVVGLHGPHSARRVTQRSIWAKEDAARQRLALRNQRLVGADGTSVTTALASAASGATVPVGATACIRTLHVGPHEPSEWLDVSRQRLS